MAQVINNISTPNDGLGDPLRTAFDKQNQMNTELYARNGSNIYATNPSTLAQEPIDDILEIFPENLADENSIPKIDADGNLKNSKITDDGTTIFIKGATVGDSNPNVVWTDSNGTEVARVDDRGNLRFSNAYNSGVIFPINQGIKSVSSTITFLINAYEDAFESKGIINYKADYKADYNSRSLVDKGYVDNLIQSDITDVTLGTAIDSFTAETPVDADTIAFSDLSDSNKAKKVSFANLKSFLKSYFDGIYATISALSNYVPTTRTINGFDLTANRTLTTANVADSTDKRYQTENQKTFNDATSSIQTQIDSNETLIIDVNPTPVISIQTTELILNNYDLKVGRIRNYDVLEMRNHIVKSINTSGSSLFYVYLSKVSNDISVGNAVKIATALNLPSGAGTLPFQRDFWRVDNKLYSKVAGTNSVQTDAVQTGTLPIVLIDDVNIANFRYIIVTATYTGTAGGYSASCLFNLIRKSRKI